MGLDMYLNKYTGDSDCASDRVYWRKANQIHGWFVRNVQDNVDNCEEYRVTTDQLKELLDLVKTVLKTKNTSLLEPTQGFFFGSYDTDDEYYWQNLRHTRDELKRLLKNINKEDNPRFTYQSSW